jgi:hypothetical protein
MEINLEEKIRSRAYAIWETEGRPHGRDRAHWEQALREVADEETPPLRATAGESAGEMEAGGEIAPSPKPARRGKRLRK